MQFGWTADEETAFAIMDAYVEAGGNFIDTADVYSTWAEGNPGGVSEEIIGRDKAIPESARAERVQERYFSNSNFDLLERMEQIGRGHQQGILQVALAWLLSNPLVTAPIVGANQVEQIQASMQAVGFRLNEEELKALDELSNWQKG